MNETLHGQNWQLMLPICFKYKIGYIDTPLFVCLQRKGSYSHNSEDYKGKVKRINEYEKTITIVLWQMLTQRI